MREDWQNVCQPSLFVPYWRQTGRKERYEKHEDC